MKSKMSKNKIKNKVNMVSHAAADALFKPLFDLTYGRSFKLP